MTKKGEKEIHVAIHEIADSMPPGSLIEYTTNKKGEPMTGKELKEFASFAPDNSSVEYLRPATNYYAMSEWAPLGAGEIRIVFTPQTTKEEESNG